MISERERTERRRMMAAGFVLRRFWVHPLERSIIPAYPDRGIPNKDKKRLRNSE